MLDTNFRTRHGELDIVAADEHCLVFCEVKTRVARAPPAGPELDRSPPSARASGASSACSPARALRARRGHPRRPDLRFDAVGVELDRQGRLLRIDHLEGAF